MAASGFIIVFVYHSSPVQQAEHEPLFTLLDGETGAQRVKGRGLRVMQVTSRDGEQGILTLPLKLLPPHGLVCHLNPTLTMKGVARN